MIFVVFVLVIVFIWEKDNGRVVMAVHRAQIINLVLTVMVYVEIMKKMG
jgi:hypothetical protein